MSKTSPEKLIAAARPHFHDDEIGSILSSISEVLTSGRLILGEQTRLFEEEFRSYIGSEYAVAVSTCTAAIQIVLRYHQIKGREVILPTNNFVGVASAVIAEGGMPVLADMDPETFCVDTQDLLQRITPHTAGIIVVDLAGLVYPDIELLQDECQRRGLFLLEDASHAHGAEIDGKKAGSLSDAGCFSFYPTKILTTSTGGMLTTNNKELADYAISVRHHGVRGGLNDVVHLGSDWCLSEIHAILGRSQLKLLEDNIQHRIRMVSRYREKLKDLTWLTIPQCPVNIRHVYYKFPTLLGDGLDRDKFRRILYEEYLIESGAIYDPPCHLQPVLMEAYGMGEGMFPKAEATLKRQFCPPIHSALTLQEVDRVVEAMMTVAKHCGFN